ncbi:hypothetical protein KAU08_10470 [bacterium]|jgi:type II secretory ATPase GspE/PulE/Tfp pilus assembly ATPase PilB-like protein|nr:hypothetical protein [bacterium]
MTWLSDPFESELYAFEPERFLVPPMEGFLRRIFGARWGMILVSAPEHIDIEQVLDFLANYSLQSAFYSEISTEPGDFYKLERDERKIKTIDEVINEARDSIHGAKLPDPLDLEDRYGINHIPRNPEIVFIHELSTDNVHDAVEASLNQRLAVAGIRAEGSFPALQLYREYVKSDHLAAASLMGIIGLNTVDRICPECKVRVEHELNTMDQLMVGKRADKFISYAGAGCEFCRSSGYKGQILIHEGFELTENLRSRLLEGTTPRQLKMYAKQEGMSTLLDAAWAVAEAGETTLDEITRIAEETDPGGTEPVSL